MEGLVRGLLASTRTRYTFILLKLTPQRLLKGISGIPYFKQLRALDQSIHALAQAQRRLPPSERGDNILADLLSAKHGDGSPFSDDEIRDAIVTMLVAGHDTTAIALAWALEQIVPRPDVTARIVAELQEVTAGQPLVPEHLPRLVYLDAAIRESLRRFRESPPEPDRDEPERPGAPGPRLTREALEAAQRDEDARP